MKQILKFLGGIQLAAVLFFIFVSSAHAATTIVVNSTTDVEADDGTCTLREAITAANTDTASGVVAGECSAGSGADTIDFAITGTASFTNGGQNGYTIKPLSALPQITETLTIDGYSQPGARVNTAIAPRPLNGRLLIEVDGSGGASGFGLRADNTQIRGLVLNRFTTAVIRIGADNTHISGNYLGTDPTGLLRRANQLNGINGDYGGFTDGDSAIIGSTNPADRNIIAGSADSGITPNVGQDGWIVKGNYIGIGADGLTSIANSYVNGPGGMSIDNCSDVLVGGTEEGATNVISGNNSFGIFPDNTTHLTIQGNIIGPDWKGDALVNNPQLGGIGLPAINGPFINTLIGGVTAGSGNVIAHNNGTGVAVVTPYYNGVIMNESKNISILGNSIYGNLSNQAFVLSESGLGIDLLSADLATVLPTGQGPTLNDPLDTDTGPNDSINYPVINSVTEDGLEVTINYSLDAAGSPENQYRVEFFANDQADPSGYGEGQTLLGASTVQNGINKQATFTLSPGISIMGKSVSATTTALNSTAASGFSSTSEFSKVSAVTAASHSAELASTGQNRSLMLVVVITGIMGMAAILVRSILEKISA